MSMEAFPEAWTSVVVDGGSEENFDFFATDLVLDSCSDETESSDGARPHIHTEFPTTLITEHSITTTTTTSKPPSTPIATHFTTTTSPACPSCCENHHTISEVRKHIGSCFVDSMPPHQSRPKQDEDDEAKSHITNISANASQLSLSQRIALLESLGRLASLSGQRKRKKGRRGSMNLSWAEESDDDVRPTQMGSDMFALSLLFSAPPAPEVSAPTRKSKRRRVVQQAEYNAPTPITINHPTKHSPAPSPAFSPLSSPKHQSLHAYETTPVHSGLDWTTTGDKASFHLDQNPSTLALSRSQAYTPPPTAVEAGFMVTGTKRNRLQPSAEVVQALNFKQSPVAFGTGDMDPVAHLFGDAGLMLNTWFDDDDDFNL